MPQGPIAVTPVSNAKSHLNITATTVVKASPGKVLNLIVGTAPGTSLSVYDSASTTGNTAANAVVTILTANLTAGQVIPLNFPCATGIVVAPVGTAGVVAVSFE
jgi:hypothetical protein